MENDESIIDIKSFENWLQSRASKLGDYVVTKSGQKYLLNSPWKLDTKRHLAILPFRGKYGRFRDFKSGKNGSVPDFIMEIDGVGFRDAMLLVSTANYTPKEKKPEAPKEKLPKKWGGKLPDGCIRIIREDENSDDLISVAYDYIKKRGIDPESYEFYYCSKDTVASNGKRQRLRHRILLAFRDWNGEIWYWTARSLSSVGIPRYIEPEQDGSVTTKEEAMFCPSWDIHGKGVMVCEGAIDAITLHLCGLRSVSIQGSNLFKAQADMLKDFNCKPIWAFDNDEPGKIGLAHALNFWKGESFYIFPPNGYDWNSFYVKHGKKELRRHIVDNMEPVDNRVRDVLSWIDQAKKGKHHGESKKGNAHHGSR
jgi:DNA primase